LIACLCAGVLYHVADCERALREIPCRSPITSGHFTMDDLPLVQRVFPTAERYILERALVFDSPEPALRFYASNRIDALRNAPTDARHRPRLLPAMRLAPRQRPHRNTLGV